jgi:hypothetical protein
MERMALRLDGAGVLHLFWLQVDGQSGQVWHKQKAASSAWTKAELLAAGFELVGSSPIALFIQLDSILELLLQQEQLFFLVGRQVNRRYLYSDE